jgi:hypothetical protein
LSLAAHEVVGFFSKQPTFWCMARFGASQNSQGTGPWVSCLLLENSSTPRHSCVLCIPERQRRGACGVLSVHLKYVYGISMAPRSRLRNAHSIGLCGCFSSPVSKTKGPLNKSMVACSLFQNGYFGSSRGVFSVLLKLVDFVSMAPRSPEIATQSENVDSSLPLRKLVQAALMALPCAF